MIKRSLRVKKNNKLWLEYLKILDDGEDVELKKLKKEKNNG